MHQKLTEFHSAHASDTKISHHSHHRRHHSSHHHQNADSLQRRSGAFVNRRKTISGVRANRIIAEKRIMFFCTLGAIVLLCILIPFITWLVDIVSETSNV